MPNTTFVKLGAALGALVIALSGAAAASADTPSPGGLGYDDPAAPSVFADGSTLVAPIGQMLGAPVAFHGTLAGSHPGDRVALQRLDPTAGWETAATALVAADGSFDATWLSDRAGKATIRVVPATAASTASAADADPSAPTRIVTVFRPAKVTWYGPGFWGKRTACGRRLTHALLGVAHRRLPCGTPVALYYQGRTITVPVVDRGPFRRGTSYDLTAATAQALGVTTTTVVGAVRG